MSAPEGTARSEGGSAREAHRPTRPRWWSGGAPALWLTAAWTAANVAWVQVYRGARLWDHEEVGYVRTVIHFARHRDPSSMWSTLHEGYAGPMQAILGAPAQWLFGVDEAALLWQSIALTAVSGLLAWWMARRLADDAAGLAAAAFVLFVPGMLENARGVLTMVPATTFALAALAALLAGSGLGRVKWSIIAGVAIGCMSLSRAMSLAFVPGMAVPAVVWSIASGVPRRVIVRNAVLAGVAALAVALWWWAFNYDDVFDYLSTGATDVGTGNPLMVFGSRISEIWLYLGWFASTVALVAFLLIDRRRRLRAQASVQPDVVLDLRSEPALVPPRASSPSDVVVDLRTEPATVHRDVNPLPSTGEGSAGKVARSPSASVTTGDRSNLPLWPLWAAVAVDLVVSLASLTVGWLMLPLVPWIIVAAVVGIRRRFDESSWRSWMIVSLGSAVFVAVLTSTLLVEPGNRFTWCSEFMRTTACAVDDDDEATRWQARIDEVVDDTFVVYETLLTEGREADIAIAARDHLVLPSSIALEAEVDHRWTVDGYRFFKPEQSHEQQLDEVRRDADIVIVSPDDEPVVLSKSMVDPDGLADRLEDAGFARCHDVQLPDGRTVDILVREPRPLGACA